MGKTPDADVLVVGAGVFGLACAWACARRGMRVIVAEAERVGAGASGGVVGALAPFAPAPWSARKAFQLTALVGAEAGWAEVAAAGGVDPGYARVGRLTPLGDAAARARAEAQARAAVGNWGGAAGMRVLDPDAAPGWLDPGAAAQGVLRDGLTARIAPRRALAALAAAVRARGGEIRCGWRAQAVEDGAARFAQGEIAAGAVIVATGAFDGLTPGLPLRAVKGQAALLAAEAPPGAALIGGDGLWIVPQGAGRVAVGSTSEQDWDGHGPDARLDAALARAASVCPALRGAAVLERWAGFRPRAGRPDPMLGPVPGRDRVFVATGGLGIGFGLALAAGAALADMAEGGAPALPQAFSVEAHLAAR